MPAFKPLPATAVFSPSDSLELTASKAYYNENLGATVFDVSLNGERVTVVQNVEDEWVTWGEFEDIGYAEICVSGSRVDAMRAVFAEVLRHIV